MLSIPETIRTMKMAQDQNSGWIKLHRKLLGNGLWRERREFSKAEAWIDIILNAQHSDEPREVWIKNSVLLCHRGQCLKSLDTWARRWGWTKSKVRRVLKVFQDCSMIVLKPEQKTTRLTICNYDVYNDVRNASETQVKRKRNASETQSTPDKNVKNERTKECKNELELCSEPPATSEPPIIEIPLIKSQGNFAITQSDINEWQETYPAVDVMAQVRKCRQWNINNPSRRKTLSGIRNHICQWLGKEQDKGGGGAVFSPRNALPLDYGGAYTEPGEDPITRKLRLQKEKEQKQ